MKTQILIAVFLGLTLGACSSSKKNSEDAKSSTEAQAEQTADKKDKDTSDKADKAKGDSAEGLSEKVTCKLGGDTRTIGIKSVDEGCEVIYTKFGESTSIASGSKGSSHCANVVTKVRDNLQNAGFSCE